MYCEDPVFRPPCEASSLIIQATLGCPHNRCTFCSMYKMKKYRVRDVDDIKADLRQARLLYNRVESIFLADGNTIAMNSHKLAEIIEYARHLFPEARRVSSYGGARFLRGKSPQGLTSLKEAGLDIIYLGLESGDDEVLEMVDKGVGSEDMIEAAHRVKETGIALSVYILLGLGGEDLWHQHAENTARVLNAMNPDFIRPRTLYLMPGCPLYDDAQAGLFREASGETIMRELEVLLTNLRVENCLFMSDHISNYIPVYGQLAEDRKKMLATVKMALENPEEHLAPRYLTHL